MNPLFKKPIKVPDIIAGCIILSWIILMIFTNPTEQSETIVFQANKKCSVILTYISNRKRANDTKIIYFGCKGGYSEDKNIFGDGDKYARYVQMNLTPEAPNPLPIGFEIELECRVDSIGNLWVDSIKTPLYITSFKAFRMGGKPLPPYRADILAHCLRAYFKVNESACN
ncbi:MAG: hypothetical protein ABI723_15220 [Bacteroidia bacterium]